ncbi:MAG TPA: M23 family metallopeptidase, partial [Chitinophagales bacterium]|nr:M23 family metallopeptidase [Chitinophagales bacterium]
HPVFAMPEEPVDLKKKKSWFERLTDKYRLVLLNDETFEEVTSFQLTRMNVYVLVSTILVILVLVTVSAIVYTPLREYIPGYADVSMRRDVMELKLRSDSLEKVLHANDLFLQNIKRVISGELDAEEVEDAAAVAQPPNYDSIDLDKVSPSENKLRKDLEEEQRFSVSKTSTLLKKSSAVRGFHFFTPLKGYITEPFNGSEQHYGVDIVAPENEPIKSTLDGIVVFANWTAETGYVMAIQHNDNLISLYKHNSVLLKEEGNYVKAGDVIAIIGNTGELTSGPHLHFELWYKGLPLNPEDYLVFK